MCGMSCCRAFAAIGEEGGLEGGIVVQDCLELLNNLLRGNQASAMTVSVDGSERCLFALFSAFMALPHHHGIISSCLYHTDLLRRQRCC